MNKLLKFCPIFALIIVFMGTFCGCIFTLSTPTLSLSGNMLVWENQDNVQKYEVVLDEKTIFAETNSLNLIYYVEDSGEHTAKIKAHSKNMFYNDSQFSESFAFTVAASKLSTPTNVKVNSQNYKYTASWNAVSNAVGYVLKLVNTTTTKVTYLESTTTQKDITENLNQTGTFVLYVRAVSADLTITAPSAYASSDEFEWVTYINTPVASLSGTTLSWENVAGAQKYIVATQEGKTKTVTTNSLNIATSGLLSSNNLTVFFVQAIANENAGYDSAYSDGVSYIQDSSAVALGLTELEYMNNSFDLCANDEAELKNIVFYAMYYRIKSINLRVEYTSGYDNAIKNQLKKYEEIMSISYSTRIMGGLVTLSITFNHANTPTLTAEGNITVVQDSRIKPISYTDTPRADSFDNFLINTRAKELTVFTSDQLYVALQNGYKPKFTSASSPAKAVYDAAKDVLREIVDDSMTEKEKTDAIYEWLSYKTKYDYNLLNYTEQLESSGGDGVQAELSKYKGFYIEGILFDNGQAVCDGISKTFVLLTNLENIDCYKVSGTASGGNHAWNKIALDLDNSGEDEYYTVDVTWGDLTTKDENLYTEYLSHSYYLVTDDMISINSHSEISPDKDVSETDYNFYQNKILTDGILSQSLLISSQAELNKLMTIVSNLNLTGIEFAVAEGASVSVGTYGSSYTIQNEQIKTGIKSVDPIWHVYTYYTKAVYCLSKK